MKRIRKGDYVKIKSDALDDNTIYIVREVGNWSVYLDWKDRSRDQCWKKVDIFDVESIYDE
jgi:hypothetical protein